MRNHYLRINCALCLVMVIGLTANRSFATTLVKPIETCRILPQHRDFKNLQSLMLRHGHGKNLRIRSMSYMEFAELINRLMDDMTERLEQDPNSIDRTDIDGIKTLQERFAPELAILRQRTGLVEIRQACNAD